MTTGQPTSGGYHEPATGVARSGRAGGTGRQSLCQRGLVGLVTVVPQTRCLPSSVTPVAPTGEQASPAWTKTVTDGVAVSVGTAGRVVAGTGVVVAGRTVGRGEAVVGATRGRVGVVEGARRAGRGRRRDVRRRGVER